MKSKNNRQLHTKDAAKLLLICNAMSKLPKTTDYTTGKPCLYSDFIYYSGTGLSAICQKLKDNGPCELVPRKRLDYPPAHANQPN